MDTVYAVLFGLMLLGLWLAPIIIADRRHHRQIGPIVIVTLLLGWSGIGWIVALAWSLSSNPPDAAKIQP